MRRMIALLAAFLSATAAAAPASCLSGSIAGRDGSWDDADVKPATDAIGLPTAQFDPPSEPGARPTPPTAGSFHRLVVRPD